MTKNYLHEITHFVLKGNLMQDKSQNLSGKKGDTLMIWEKMSCINGWIRVSIHNSRLNGYIQPSNISSALRFTDYISASPTVPQKMCAILW